jgi:hypothetical protein
METIQLQISLSYETVTGYPCCFTHAVQQAAKGYRVMEQLRIDRSDGFSGGGKALPDRYPKFACHYCAREAREADKALDTGSERG